MMTILGNSYSNTEPAGRGYILYYTKSFTLCVLSLSLRSILLSAIAVRFPLSTREAIDSLHRFVFSLSKTGLGLNYASLDAPSENCSVSTTTDERLLPLNVHCSKSSVMRGPRSPVQIP